MIVVCAVAAAGSAARADVYGNAYVWMRGVGADANANGHLDNGELHDALNGITSFSATTYNANGLQFTNQLVNLPYRGVARTMNCLHFVQNTVVTNENGWGYMDPASFQVANILKPLMKDNADDVRYAFAIRFRPEDPQPHTNYSWIVNLSHGGSTPKRGVQLGFGPIYNRAVTSDGITTTSRFARVYFMYGGSSWVPSGSNTDGNYPFIGFNEWNDIVVSVEGRNVKMLASRDGHRWPSARLESSRGKFNTSFASTTVASSYNLSPNGATLRFGAESSVSGRTAWDSRYTGTSYNAWKHFRGSIQSFAIWTNALTEAQMREAAAWPRTDIWRVGVENDATTEFGSGQGDEAVDADRWNVPRGIAAGGQVTLKFPLDATGEAEMNEEIRLKATSASASATVQMAVNGVNLGAKPVTAGQERWWVVPAQCLLAGATNTLVLTRTDAGAGTLQIDALSFGGSLQYGKRDNSYYEFVREFDCKTTYDLIGGNWFDGRRAIFGQGASASSISYTNIILKFDMPQRLRETYDWKMKFRFRNTGYKMRLVLNGTDLGDYATGDSEHEVPVPPGALQAENLLNVMNVGTGTSYVTPDYLRLSFDLPPNGTFLFLR